MQKSDNKPGPFKIRKEKNISIRIINIGSANFKAIFMALIAAALYSISTPFSKLLLKELPPTFLASLLYFGAGIGMLAVISIQKLKHKEQVEAKITRKEFPYVLAMILLDVAAPILLMFGLSLTTSANAALLNNFEIAATTFLALFLFKEAVGKRMWVAIVLITLASLLLSIDDFNSFSFSVGSVYVLAACICWGFENNCTRMLSLKDPYQIVAVKGIGSGMGALIIALLKQQLSTNIMYLLMALLLGFIAYGLSIYCYILAQRELGAARTSAFYATAPFIGVLISFLVFREAITVLFVLALIIMLFGTYLAVSEVHKHVHQHNPVTHEHKHNHEDGHHNHTHVNNFSSEHSHQHTHEIIMHSHKHTPDTHHSHKHTPDT